MAAYADAEGPACRAATLLAKASSDSNAAALDKALDAVLGYLTCASEAGAARWAAVVLCLRFLRRQSATQALRRGCPSCRLAAPFCAALVKSNLKQRPGTVSKCSEICVALVELEQAETVVVRASRR